MSPAARVQTMQKPNWADFGPSAGPEGSNLTSLLQTSFVFQQQVRKCGSVAKFTLAAGACENIVPSCAVSDDFVNCE